MTEARALPLGEANRPVGIDSGRAVAGGALHHAERQLLDSVERILRNPGTRGGWMLLALHLCKLPAPGPREHHRRIVAVMLGEMAERSEGRLFAMTNGDVSLLFRPADAGTSILSTLQRLFEAEVEDAAALSTLWPLPEGGMGALAHITTLTASGGLPAPRPEPQASPSVLAAMDGALQNADLSDFMQRQTAVLLRPGHAQQVTPLYREVGISTGVLETRFAMPGQIQADPFLFSHMAAQLDRRMLAALLRDLPTGGPLSGGLRRAALHVNLTIDGILSEAFTGFAAACRPFIESGLRVAVEVQLTELFADPRAFVVAREQLRLAGLQLVVDGVTQQTLLLTKLATLEPMLVKLTWSPALMRPGKGVEAAIGALGLERIVLHRAESEAAVVWGLAHGIQRFQGHYIDAMLAAERLRGCAGAAACTLRLCSGRASATAAAGRSGCTNRALLDTDAPPRRLAA